MNRGEKWGKEEMNSHSRNKKGERGAVSRMLERVSKANLKKESVESSRAVIKRKI